MHNYGLKGYTIASIKGSISIDTSYNWYDDMAISRSDYEVVYICVSTNIKGYLVSV